MNWNSRVAERRDIKYHVEAFGLECKGITADNSGSCKKNLNIFKNVKENKITREILDPIDYRSYIT